MTNRSKSTKSKSRTRVNDLDPSNYSVYRAIPDKNQRRSKKGNGSKKYTPAYSGDIFDRFKARLQPNNLRRYWLSRHGVLTMLKLFALMVVAVTVFAVVVIINLRNDLPQIQSLYGKNLNGSIMYYDRTGKVLLWTDYNGVNRSPVSGNKMSSYVRNATVAIEDKNFYHEGPIDYGGILRSAYHDLFSSSSQLEGGSTITQQLVKLNEGWLGNVTIWRKIKEVFLAYDMSRKFSKATILTGYLNIAPYGGVDYGIQAAAEDYFNIPASSLSLAQSAMLAAIPQSPAYYSPRSPSFSAQALTTREDYILGLMQQQGYITKQQQVAATAVNVLSEVQPSTGLYSNMIAPYFDLMAKAQLQSQFGGTTAKEGGWKVITTLSVPQQNEAQALVANNLHNVINGGGDEEAMVVENAPTGQVTALIGGTNFYNTSFGQINYANIRINPGSTYKLYDYTALIDENKNVGAGSVIYDSQSPLPGYPCTNKALPLNGGNCLYDYDYQYPGPLTLRYALAGSRNVPAVKSALINGEQKTIALSKAMGLTSGYDCYANTARTILTTCYGSAAIGEGGYLKLNETVNGFATDSRLGNYVPQTFIDKIIGVSGNTVYQWKQPPVDQVVKPDAAYIIDNILSDPSASYLPGYCNATNCTPISSFGWKFQHTNGWDVAIKTGTTHNDETGLMMGMTTQYVVGSWVGYHTATKQLTPHYGGLEGLTEPLTRGMITYLTQNQKPINWVAPVGIKVLPAYVVDHPPGQVMGFYYGWVYPSPSTDLYPSWYDGKVTPLTPTCDAAVFSVDTFYTAPAYQNAGCVAKPTNTITDPSIVINNVSCADVANNPNQCSVTVTATRGTYPLATGPTPSNGASEIELMVGSQVVSTVPIAAQTPNVYTTSISVSNLPPGSIITAKVIDNQLKSGSTPPYTVTQ